MDDFGDRAMSRVVHFEPLDQHLEGAAIAFVAEIGLEHVEADFPILRLVPACRNEFECSLGIDKALDQPGARHPIDVNSLACDPNASAILAARRCGLIVSPSIPLEN